MTKSNQKKAQIYQSEVEKELENILNFWLNHTFDTVNGGFIGKMDSDGHIDTDAPKGLVLNARILWTFSAAYKRYQKPKYLIAAERAFEALIQFANAEYGGFHWSIQPDGTPLSTRKQIYGLAFALYGLSEFYAIKPTNILKSTCIDLFQWIEKYSFNPDNQGYLEAVSRDGSPLTDMRLSPKDRNDPLSMNTHLHILEAYTNLYRIWKNDILKRQIENLIDIFLKHIIDSKTNHLLLFFNVNWRPTDDTISYGHDIEAAWLVIEAAEVINYKVAETKKIAIKIAQAVSKGLDTEGGLNYESQRPERHWWVQAEAMVGFLTAYQLSKKTHFLNKSLLCWDYIKKYFIDYEKGEWFWGYTEGWELMRSEDKVGFWKCPYHNARACMEVSQRLENLYLPNDTEEVQEAEALASQLTDDNEIKDAFKKMLLQSDDEERLRKRYDRTFNKNHPKHQAYKAALNRFLEVMEQNAQNLLNEADSLLTSAKTIITQ